MGRGAWRENQDAYSRADYELKLIQAARESHVSAAGNEGHAAFGAESLDLHGAGTWREIKDASSRAVYEMKLIQAARETHAAAADTGGILAS